MFICKVVFFLQKKSVIKGLAATSNDIVEIVKDAFYATCLIYVPNMQEEKRRGASQQRNQRTVMASLISPKHVRLRKKIKTNNVWHFLGIILPAFHHQHSIYRYIESEVQKSSEILLHCTSPLNRSQSAVGGERATFWANNDSPFRTPFAFPDF